MILIYSLLGLFIIWLLDRLIPIVHDYFEYRRLKNEGVVFMGNNTYSIIRDLKLTKKTFEKYPTCVSFYKMLREDMKTEQLPQICARIFMGEVILLFNSVE
jgi:hypothetical protein